MARRASQKTSVLDDLYEMLLVAPVWLGPILACAVFAGLQWLLPWALTPSDTKDVMKKTFFGVFGTFSVKAAPWGASLVLAIWLFALIGKSSHRRRLDQQTGIESIRSLSWHDFEQLLAEAFLRQGYDVEHVGRAGPDGGVDLRLRRDNEVVLVQCKQWLVWNVGVKVVRELYGVVAAERATRGVLVTSGGFSNDAESFARTVPVTLIDGNELVRMIDDVRASKHRMESPKLVTAVPSCPTCGVSMKLRTAKQGKQPGSQFWGCSKYPNCRGTRPYS